MELGTSKEDHLFKRGGEGVARRDEEFSYRKYCFNFSMMFSLGESIGLCFMEIMRV